MAKKIKKVETPIDQRETFVSIQKNFADSELSVEEKLKTLYALQKADSEIDKILQLRGELPVEVENLENEVLGLKTRAAQINTEIDTLNSNITDYKHQIVECDTAIEKYKNQMDSVTNSREYDSLSKEVENQDLLKLIDKLSELAVGLMAAKKAELADIKDEANVRNEDLKAKKEELSNIVESTAKEEKVLRTKRDACAALIDPRTMSAYERIRQSERNHLAVVSVFNGNACGGCFNKIPPQRQLDIKMHKKIIVCEYCGRMLQYNYPAETYRHRFEQEARHLRALRKNYRKFRDRRGKSLSPYAGSKEKFKEQGGQEGKP